MFGVPKLRLTRAPKPPEKRRDWWWLYRDGSKKDAFDERGHIRFEILWEYGSKIDWGIGGAHDRGYLEELISDNLYEDERAVLIAANISNIKHDEYRQRILRWIQSTIQKKNRGYFEEKYGEPGEYRVP